MEEWMGRWLNALLGLLGISSMAAVSRSILSEDRRSFAGFLRGFILAVFVGGVIGAAIQDMDFSAPTQGAIVGLAAFISDDILLLVISISKHMRENPKDIIGWILRKKS